MELDLPRAVLEAERKAEEALQRLKSPTPAPAAAAPASEPAPAPEPAPPAPAPAPEGDEKWEARYKSLHGKYNAEVPRLHQAIRDKDAQLAALTEEVEALKKQKDSTPLVKPEEIQEFGEPLVDLIRRAAREEVSVKDKEIAELKQTVNSVKTASEQTTEASFYERLAATVPDWMAVNDDPEFHAWLAEHDELAGVQRQHLLSEAEKRRDATRVARFFDAYKKTKSKSEVASAGSLESQVAPATTKTESMPASKKIWARGEIADFYARLRRGEYSAEQAGAIDKDIQSAVREGRVR